MSLTIEPGVGRRCCEGKVRYVTQGAADIVVDVHRGRRRKGKHPSLLTSYRCGVCSFWHVGNRRPPRRR